MIRIEEMNRRLAEALRGARLPSVMVRVRDARGRVLAADQASRLDLPPFDKSAMDGYAILPDDERTSYRLLGTVAAGQAAAPALSAGTTVKVMTGAPVPAGAGRVVMQEDVEEKDGVVSIARQGGGVNICRMGEDVRRGDVIMSAGKRLDALEIANLVASGITEVEVVRPVRVAIISTGDEIVEHPDQLEPGKIVDTNTPLLEALAAAHGLEVASVARIPDQRDSTAQAIRAGVEAADVVVLSGGISVGEFDTVHDALADLGIHELFAGVAIKPGRPLTLAQTATGKIVAALPGNPVSVYLMFHLCLLRIAALLSGAEPGLRELELELGHDIVRKNTKRQEYVPARVSDAGVVLPVEFHGSAHLTALMNADGFLVVPIGPAALLAGSRVRFLPLGRI
jgi:molybdopterin molybdotransferase